MKNRFLISMLATLFVAGIMASCDLFDKADDISFSTEFKESFNVEDGNGSYAKTITLDATTDPEVAKYKEKIQKIALNKVTYMVSNYVGSPDATFSGDVLFGLNGKLGTVGISGLNLADASGSGAEMELDLSQDEVNAVAAQLKGDKAVDVTMAGEFTNGPVNFTVTVKINAKVTADAL
ncbi:MAG TPA: hypothetical protein PKW06_01145 [Cyclobacteriaceae bacterium]|nr:hypothetical protein [Cyclobacteriaceae bacterium]MCB9237768.1 hypothetical protein [Flammeovirgaceae bacterium]MCB0498720.1 hypothetical protein [Cyclobacteriaceae bacterium]MCO5270131.1 hypothetical protein [Cyclobacteriaceae bacterium]MCW5903129.1 hypothetical protein [Cyclobacteriaceae bacterium]